MRIIDTHNHLWKLENNDDFSWITVGMEKIKRDFTFSDLQKTLMVNKVQGSILVQAIAQTQESEKLLQLADRKELIKGVVGWCDIAKGGQYVQNAIDNLRNKGSLLKGIRYMSQGLPKEHMIQHKFIEGCQTVGKNGLVYELLVTAEQLDAAVILVQSCPDVTFVIEHIAKPDIKNHKIKIWKTRMKELLSSSDKIYCKVSGMVTEADWENWQENDFLPYLDAVYEIFGDDNIIFGSDWPVSLTAAEYLQVVEIIKRWLVMHPEVESDKIFYANAVKLYQLEI